MSFTPSEVAFLRRLLESRREQGTGKIAHDLATTHHIGHVHRSQVRYGTRDFEAAENALRSRGYELQARPAGMLRSDAGPGGSEKDGAQRVMADLVAVVPMNMAIAVPAGARFVAAKWHELDLAAFDVILECENLEALMDLGRFSWLDRFIRGRRTLAVFRGMPNSFPTGAAAAFIAAACKPVMGFYDFDPEGLTMAASEPRLEALCLPSADGLIAATREFHRTHLFLDQVVARRPVLDALAHGPVHDAWLLLKKLQCGLNQENFPR